MRQNKNYEIKLGQAILIRCLNNSSFYTSTLLVELPYFLSENAAAKTQ